MADMMQAARTAVKLEAALQTMKRLHGDKWDERAAPYRAVLNGVIGTEGCSVLEAALPIAKAMSEAGETPVMLLAVAAEMCNANKPKANHPWRHNPFMGHDKKRQTYNHGYRQRENKAAQAAKGGKRT